MRVLVFPEILMLSLTFARPWVMLWLLAIAVPLVIHVLMRRRRRVVDWAATRLLRKALDDAGWRRARVAQRLLLAVRCSAVAVAVMALAGPVTDGGRGPAPAGGVERRVLVLDVSYSMEYQRGGRSLLERSRQWARRIIRQGLPETNYVILTMGRRPSVVAEGPRGDGAQLITAIDKLDATHGSAHVAATWESIRQLLHGRKVREQRFGRTEVFVFTDLSAASWKPVVTALGNPSRRDVKADVPIEDPANELASIIICDVGASEFSNSAVANLGATSGKAAIGQPVELTASVAHFGSRRQGQPSAQWWIDGAPGPRQTLSFDTRSRAELSLTHTFAQTGLHNVQLRLDPDALVLDDSRLLCVPVAEQLHVLCVGGKFGATHYLLRALQPDLDAGGPIAVTDAPAGTLLDHSLNEFDCIMLANVPRLMTEETRALRGFLERGGGVIWFLGDEVEPQRYNLVRNSDEDGRPPIVPARLNGVIRTDRNGIDPLGFQHPILRPFRGPGAAALSTTPVFSHVRLKLEGSPGGTRVAAAFGNGDPAIVVAPVGQGTSIVVATAASLASIDGETGRPWTAWPAWPSFLPLVRELMNHSTVRHADRFNTLVGEPLTLSTAKIPRMEVKVIAPNGNTSIVPAAYPSRNRQFRATDRRGLYVVRGGAGSSEHFAVNLDTKESDLQRVDATSLPAEIEIRSETEARGTSGPRARSPWHGQWTLISVLLVVLLLESTLAAWLMTPGSRNKVS